MHRATHTPSRTPGHTRTGSRAGSRTGFHSGFTLIEVLVALAIVAVALLAGLQASGGLVRSAERQTLAMWAQACAENELIRLRLLRQLPSTGNRSSECVQAGHSLQLQVQVDKTPNPNFHRVDVRVAHMGHGLAQVSTVMGRR